MDKKRKILIAAMGLDIGGAETHIVELSHMLSSMGYSVITASAGGAYAAELESCGIHNYTVPMNKRRPWPMLVSLIRLFKIIRREHPDIVHAHARIPAFICGILHRFMNFPFVTTAHWVFDTGGALGSLTNWGQKVIAVSDDIKTYLMQNYAVPEKNITVTINGIDTEKFSPDISGSEIRADLGIPDNVIVISHVSRLDESRALAAQLLINSSADLCKKFPGIRVVIAGGGDCFEKMSASAERVNTKLGYKCIHLLGPRTDINKIVAAGDIFVGVSRAVLEAMAVGKPVIIAGNEGYQGIFTPEKLDEAILGNFCCRGMPQCTQGTLAKDIAELLNYPKEITENMCTYNRSVILDHYSVSRMTNDTLAVYKSMWRPKTAVVSGYYGYNNLGDDAILLSIKKRLENIDPTIRLIALSNAPEITKSQYGVDAVSRFNIRSVFKAIDSSDLLISGGGSLLQDRTSTRSILYYLAIIKIALHRHKPVMLYANGIGPVTKPANRRRVCSVLDRVDTITLRDPDSLEELHNIGVRNNNITIASDPVFTIDGISGDDAGKLLSDIGLPRGRPIVAVSIRKAFGAENSVGELAKFCDLVSRTHTVLFLIMQTPEDLQITEEIQKRMSSESYTFQSPGDPEAMMGVVGLCDIVFSMRLHTVIFAAKMRVPVLGLIYDPKVASYIQMLNMESCGTPTDFSASEAFESFTKIAVQKNNYIKELDSAVKKLEKSACENERQLCRLLGLEMT